MRQRLGARVPVVGLLALRAVVPAAGHPSDFTALVASECAHGPRSIAVEGPGKNR
jgi:hypothetical protein